MPPIDRLIALICRRPPEARFDDVRRLLELSGWTMRHPCKGSHCSFIKPGRQALTVPNHQKKVKRVYLDQVCDALEIDVID